MKVKSIVIQGFRGFNEERSIDFHDKLTLIYAPNSYGKTSISEAFEWLLYGVTWKVDTANSKEEYKGSYRNCHLPESLTPYVKVIFTDCPDKIEVKGELLESDAIKRFVNEKEVEAWPFFNNFSEISKPFIFQHALKSLLLVKPTERFQGFSRLLGLEYLNQIQQNFQSLGTKPDANIPDEIKRLRDSVTDLGNRLSSQATLSSIFKFFRKGKDNIRDTYNAIIVECKHRIPPGTETELVLPELKKIREDAVGKIFNGNITLQNYSEQEKQNNSFDENYFLNCITEDLIEKYIDLIKLATVQHVIDQCNFFDLGLKIFDENPEKCPFCGQLVNDAHKEHIHGEHLKLSADKDRYILLETQRNEILSFLKELRTRLSNYQKRNVGKVAPLLALESSLKQLKTILASQHQIHYNAVETAIFQFEKEKQNLDKSFNEVLTSMDKIELSINESKEDSNLIKVLGELITNYIFIIHSLVKLTSENVHAISDASLILKKELDILAKTEDISILVELLEKWQDVEKKFLIDAILESLKELRKSVDQCVAKKIQNAVSSELTSQVMGWYEQVKTESDPKVHFNGFDMERTKKGEFKARNVNIKATSYGKDLVSAVSSLSESKLNALGLCVSLATNLNENSPFKFIIIDDPIQSWDANHEIQFIDVIRKLVEHGKQVILLSHNQNWMNQVRSSCRTLNGIFYEITGYAKEGPYISEIPWERWSERLKEVDAILKNPEVGTLRLQQAEQEIRIIVAQLTSELYLKKRKSQVSPHKLNSSKVRKILIECGVEQIWVDKIYQTFETTDDAHHAPSGYEANRERIRQYYNWIHEFIKKYELK